MNPRPSSWTDTIVETSVFFLFSLFFYLDYLSLALGLIPRQFTWLPEVISLGILFYIFIRLFREKKLIPIISQTQLVIFFIVLTVLGLIINRVALPVALAGIRNNLKYLPLFFLPFFFRFDKDFMRKFLLFLFVLALLQLPAAVIQRIVYATLWGDVVGGTLGAHSTGILAVFLTLSLACWSFYFLKARLKTGLYILGFFILLTPLGLNETKISFFLIPVAFTGVFLFSPDKKRLAKKMLVVFLCFAVGIVFIGSLYNYMYTWKEEDVTSWVQEREARMKTRIEKQTEMTGKEELDKEEEPEESQKQGVTERRPSRYRILEYLQPQRIRNILYDRKRRQSGTLNRIPQVVFAFDNIKKDTVHLLFGVGAGNASDSFFTLAQGKYYQKHGDMDIGNNLLSRMLWEYGLIGTTLFFFIFVFLFFKIWRLRKGDGIIGTAASGYLVLIAIFFITSIYFNTMLMNLFGYLFWFLGGYMLAYRYHGDDLKETSE